jgi:hypothetical protein
MNTKKGQFEPAGLGKLIEKQFKYRVLVFLTVMLRQKICQLMSVLFQFLLLYFYSPGKY